jgi:WhiB family transcriptional regulator, redox-sensing transcriptional regulator
VIALLDELMVACDWIDLAECRGMDTGLFFPERGELTAQAKATCQRCDVQAECLAYAMNNREHYGIWGGLSERQRRRLRGWAPTGLRLEASR